MLKNKTIKTITSKKIKLVTLVLLLANSILFAQGNHLKIDINPFFKTEFLEKYETYKSKVAKILAIKCISEFFTEICVYGNSRPQKFLNFIADYESIKPYLSEEEKVILDKTFYIYSFE